MADRANTTRRAVLKAFPMFGVAAVAASVPAAEAAPRTLEPLVWPEDRMVIGSHPVPTPIERMEAAMTELRRAMASYMADKEGSCFAMVNQKPGPKHNFVSRIYEDASGSFGFDTETIIQMGPA